MHKRSSTSGLWFIRILVGEVSLYFSMVVLSFQVAILQICRVLTSAVREGGSVFSAS